MPQRKIPVGKQPICDPAYIRRIDPIWTPGPVPRYFWEDPEHRRDYMLWLGHKLHFRYMEDWYKLNFVATLPKFVIGPRDYWQRSPIIAVKECFPAYDWKEWLFDKTPVGFWHSKQNRHQYMVWLGILLGFKKTEDWYRLNSADFYKNKGGSLFKHYRDSVTVAVKAHFPQYEWHEWLFDMAPHNFWRDRKNHRRYMAWLGEQLGFKQMEDWYRVSIKDFQDNKGGAFLIEYRWSVVATVMANFPKYDWKEWLFEKSPISFWDVRKNRRRYLKWLGEQLGYRHWSDWYKLTVEAVTGRVRTSHCGAR